MMTEIGQELKNGKNRQRSSFPTATIQVQNVSVQVETHRTLQSPNYYSIAKQPIEASIETDFNHFF